MIDSRRLCLDLHINSRPVVKFEGEKTYISTGDSDDMENADTVTFHNRPSRANVAPIKNDVIFAKMANTDKTFLIDEDLATNIYSTGFFDVSSTRILPKFLYYLIQSDEFDSYKNAYSEGTTQISISDKRLKKIKITYETEKAKQRQIVNYLDKKVGIIDRLIENINQQIEDLKSYKQNVITEAVTTGLKPDVGMKNVELDWIEQIPKDWQVNKTNALFVFYKGLSITKENLKDSGLSVLSYGQIHAKNNNFVSIADDLIRFVDVEYRKFLQSRIHVNDFVFADTSEDLIGCGNFCYNREIREIFAGYHTLVLHSKYNQDNRFFAYLFTTDKWRQQIRKFVCGVKVFSITKRILSQTTVLIPSYNEQVEIADFLDNKCVKIDNLLQIKQQKISELTEYKKSLIYECVTGKKEVL